MSPPGRRPPWRALSAPRAALDPLRRGMAAAALRFRRARLGLSAPALLVLSFFLLVVLGTAGLMWLPGLQRGEPLGFIDSLFTMTSAVCVTGLVVTDTATHFTRAGQAWILLFVQLGGLGLLTLTTLIIGALGRRLTLRAEMVVGAPGDFQDARPVVQLALTVARYTLLAEVVGAVLLFLFWLPRFGVADAAWHAVFQSVSAFCNAGFSTFSDSLVSFADSPHTLGVMMALIVLGGLGFLSTEEVIRWWRGRRRGERVRLSAHTWAALWVTAVLLGGGFAAYVAAEWSGTLSGMHPVDRVTNAMFMSVTARSSGFNTVPYEALGNSAVLVTLLLMGVGGCPGSTAGGLKTTTVAVLAALAFARFRGRRFALLHGRTVPEGTVQRTVSVVLLVTAIVVAAIFALGVLESRPLPIPEARQAFLPVVFEVVSAFFTVGLSMGATSGLGEASRLLVIVLMFIGRVGPLVFFAAISLQARPRHLQIREAAEDIVVG